ncbi:MAG: PLP-dependent aminotransferase family protein [Lautropia sp.]
MARQARQGSLIWRHLFRRAGARADGLQIRLRDTIVHAVMVGVLKPGDALPSSRWLAASLQVSRTTVSLALQRLCDAGTIVARPRSAMIVNPDIARMRVEPPVRQPEPTGSRRADWHSRLTRAISRQRNIVKPRDWQRYPYPFIYGQFDAQLFPFTDWRECVLESMHRRAVASWAPDHVDQDSDALIDEIQARLLPARGIWAERGEILLTAGAQHACFLLASLLLTPDTRIGIEDPGFPDARNTFRMHTRRVVPLPVDDGGVVVGPGIDRCDYVFVTPSHQCPTTVTMSIERRLSLLERARAKDVVIIEDDHESELNHAGSPTPALKSLDADDRVVYVGSLSKTLAHGLRLGYVVGPAALISELRALRRLMLRHPATNNAFAAAVFIRHGHHEAYLRRLNRAYRERAQAMRESLGRWLPQCPYRQAAGGSALWLELPESVSAGALAQRARAEGVIIEPGDVFYARMADARAHLRLGYSSIDARRIDAGIRIVSRLLDDAR